MTHFLKKWLKQTEENPSQDSDTAEEVEEEEEDSDEEVEKRYKRDVDKDIEKVNDILEIIKNYHKQKETILKLKNDLDQKETQLQTNQEEHENVMKEVTNILDEKETQLQTTLKKYQTALKIQETQFQTALKIQKTQFQTTLKEREKQFQTALTASKGQLHSNQEEHENAIKKKDQEIEKKEQKINDYHQTGVKLYTLYMSEKKEFEEARQDKNEDGNIQYMFAAIQNEAKLENFAINNLFLNRSISKVRRNSDGMPVMNGCKTLIFIINANVKRLSDKIEKEHIKIFRQHNSLLKRMGHNFSIKVIILKTIESDFNEVKDLESIDHEILNFDVMYTDLLDVSTMQLRNNENELLRNNKEKLKLILREYFGEDETLDKFQNLYFH